MNNELKKQIEEILEQAEVADNSERLLTQALAVNIAMEDGRWIKSTFQLAANLLKLAIGDKEEANRVLPWLLFSLGIAYERNTAENAKIERREL